MGWLDGLRPTFGRADPDIRLEEKDCEHESVEWRRESHWREGIFPTDSHGLVYVQHSREYKRCADCHTRLGEDGQPNTRSPERRPVIREAHSLYSEPIGDELDAEELRRSLV